MRRRQALSVTALAASSDAGAGKTSSTRGSGRRKQTASAMGGAGGSKEKKRPPSSTSSKRAAPPPPRPEDPAAPNADFDADFDDEGFDDDDDDGDDDARVFAQLTSSDLTADEFEQLPLLDRFSSGLRVSEAAAEDERQDLSSAPVWAGRRGGYTPFEYVDFTDEDVLHEVQVRVSKPRSHVFEVWADRLNYGEWFSLLGQAVLHADSPELASYFVFYRWGTLPPLELYATLSREVEPGESVLERSVDGWDLAVGAFFEADPADPEAATLVTLRLGYALPAPLAEHVGSVGIYGHVEEILRSDMQAMKRFVETGGGSDLAALRERRREEEAALASQVQEERSKGADSVLVAASQAESQGLYDEEVAAYCDEERGGGGGGGGGGEGGETSGSGVSGVSKKGTSGGQKSRGGSRRSKTAAAAAP